MTIVEFAYLSLAPPTTSKTPKLLSNLVTVTEVIQASSGLPTRFLSSTIDERVMFVIGGWPSRTAHQDGFEGSKEQAQLFPLIEGMMQIDWMEYFDVEHQMVPVDYPCSLALVMKCGVLESEARQQIWDRVNERQKAVRLELEGLIQDRQVPVVCAWNIKKQKQEFEEDVLVCFSGWDDTGLAYHFVEAMKDQGKLQRVQSLEPYFMKRAELGQEASL